MEFHPCIDIHNGKVKQIIGGSLNDFNNYAAENFISEQNAYFYAKLYKSKKIKGGHIIILNSEQSEFYKASREEALAALAAYPLGLQIGGGITADNAVDYIKGGASHVIVTSYVFKDGTVNYENLDKLVEAVGRDKIVLDLSCRKKENQYYIVTDRWQKYTNITITEEVLIQLSAYCDEFLIHAVDVEGKSLGIERNLVELLSDWEGIPITYAGGVGSYKDLEILKVIGKNKINVTVGSALDIFGGSMELEKVLQMCD